MPNVTTKRRLPNHDIISETEHLDAEARVCPSGLNATLVTVRLWSTKISLYIYGAALWRKLVSKFTMGRLLSRIAASHSTGSNRRSSHVYPYFTQLRALMYLFRSVRAPTLQAAASAHPQHGRCPPGLRGRQDVSGFAAPVCRRPRCLQYGRLSPHQPVGGRRRAHNPTRLSSRLGSGSGRASRGPQGYLPQPRRLHWRE